MHGKFEESKNLYKKSLTLKHQNNPYKSRESKYSKTLIKKLLESPLRRSKIANHSSKNEE